MLIIGSGDLILRLKMNVTSAPKTLYKADEGVNITGRLTARLAGRFTGDLRRVPGGNRAFVMAAWNEAAEVLGCLGV